MLSFQNEDNFIRNLVTIRTPGHAHASVIAQKLNARLDEALPIPVADLQLDLRIDSEDDEATLERLERGACDLLERRTGHVILPGLYQLDLPAWWWGQLEVMRGPLRQVNAITYLSEATPGEYDTADLAQFWIDEQERTFTITPLRSFERPTLWSEVHRVRVMFEAGYKTADESGDSDPPPEMPDGLRTTLTMLVGHFYENRDLFKSGKLAEVESSAGYILNAFRQFW